MKKVLIGGVIAVAVVVVAIMMYMISSYNMFIRQENGIIAAHEDLQNVHASIFNNLKSQGLTVEKYGDMVTKAITTAIEGRYGADGAKMAVLALKEENPTIDSAVFVKLQTAIEAGYSRFESAQRTKIDRIRVYDDAREGYFRSMVASRYGFPRKVTTDIKATITTAETKEMVTTKEMKTIDPFAK